MAEPIAITLRRTTLSDLETLFTFQVDEEAVYLAAFTPENPADKAAYLEKYRKHLADPTIYMCTIIAGEDIAGSIAKFVLDGRAEITYWIDKRFWGKGIATNALRQLLEIVPDRPVRGSAAADNRRSQRVLEKCGFVRTGTGKGFANARQTEIEEFIYTLT